MKCFILAWNGMVGHVVARYLAERGHGVAGCEENSPLLSDWDALKGALAPGDYDAVINCAAVINQDADRDKLAAVRVNAWLPHALEALTANTKTVVVHRSTDCIFSGARGNYGPEDWPDAASFYARSKALGEIANDKDITIRTSLIGPETDENGTGLFNWFYRQRGDVNGFANAIWTGITTIEFAREIEELLETGRHGLFQLVPDHAIGKYDLLRLFEQYYPGGRAIHRIENQRVDKSLRPVTGGVKVPDYEAMIADMRRWTDSHPELYRYR